ncbi:MAG: DNA-directed RNA polymerase subunit omega [Clostridiales bacterium]|jgi:DNA-directed RNA polymerase subunit omega|nr:DNA-directed RNA polymerase subunit omega [Clostridiales bacterium]
MLKPSADLIISPKQSRYSLVIAVAKRARQIAAEAEEKGEILVEKPVDLAVQDFIKHRYEFIEHVEPNDDMPEDL